MSGFRIVEHVARCQHIRQRPAAVELGHGNELRLAVKQYIPKDNPRPQPGDVTIIAGHANGFPKELYEPLWDDLLQSLQKRGRNICSIWIADIVNQGQSGILNEKILGPDREEPLIFCCCALTDLGKKLTGLIMAGICSSSSTSIRTRCPNLLSALGTQWVE